MFCDIVSQENQTVNSISEFVEGNPAYLTHNITRETVLQLTIPDDLNLNPKRILADESTSAFTDIMFKNQSTLINFIDLVYHTLNSSIMVNINDKLISLFQPIIDLNNEKVIVIVKGGNLLNIYYNFFQNIVERIAANTGVDDINQAYKTYKPLYFKVSDCDFNLYIITKCPLRYNLLYSIVLPLCVKAMESLQSFFETQFTNSINNIRSQKRFYPNKINSPIFNPNQWNIIKITRIDKFITNDLEINDTILINQVNIKLLYDAIHYNSTKNIYLLYHAVNYLVILNKYAVENKYRNLLFKLFIKNPVNPFDIAYIKRKILNLINEKKDLIRKALDIKRNALYNFYTKNKLDELLRKIVESMNAKFKDSDKKYVEYKNYMKLNKTCDYGESIMTQMSFEDNNNDIQSDQVTYQPIKSKIIISNLRLSNTDILSLNSPVDNHNYITLSHIKSSFNNTLFNIAFSLLRIKLNIQYSNNVKHDSAILNKKKFKIDENGNIGHEILNNVLAQPPDNIIAINIPSELIDLGIAHFSDYGYKKLLSHMSDMDDFVSCISFSRNRNDYIIGYSLNYIVADIYQMLWHQTGMPWTDLKYQKRLDRFMFIFMFNIIKTYKTKVNSIRILETAKLIYDDIFVLNEIYIQLLSNNTQNNIDLCRDKCIELINKYFKNPELVLNINVFKDLINFDITNILQAKDEYFNGDYKHFKYLIYTIIHYIYNLFVIITFTSEDIYNFYYQISNRSNFKKTEHLDNYLGKIYRADGTSIFVPRPRDPNDKDIVKDINLYLNNYVEIFGKWYTFFNNILNNSNNRLLSFLYSNISDISGGGRQNLHSNEGYSSETDRNNKNTTNTNNYTKKITNTRLNSTNTRKNTDEPNNKTKKTINTRLNLTVKNNKNNEELENYEYTSNLIKEMEFEPFAFFDENVNLSYKDNPTNVFETNFNEAEFENADE